MENERLNYLLAYLDRLIKMEDTSFNCRLEISECIDAVREELEIHV